MTTEIGDHLHHMSFAGLVIAGEPVPAGSLWLRCKQAWRLLRGKPLVVSRPVFITNCTFYGDPGVKT